MKIKVILDSKVVEAIAAHFIEKERMGRIVDGIESNGFGVTQGLLRQSPEDLDVVQRGYKAMQTTGQALIYGYCQAMFAGGALNGDLEMTLSDE